MKQSIKKDFVHAGTRLGRPGTSDLMNNIRVSFIDHTTCTLPCIRVKLCENRKKMASLTDCPLVHF